MKAANKSHSKMDVEMEILKRTSKQTLKYRVEVGREGTMLTSYTLMPNETRWPDGLIYISFTISHHIFSMDFSPSFIIRIMTRFIMLDCWRKKNWKPFVGGFSFTKIFPIIKICNSKHDNGTQKETDECMNGMPSDDSTNVEIDWTLPASSFQAFRFFSLAWNLFDFGC